MSPEKMVYMANQIATFFKTQPGDDAAKNIASHIQDFWEPRMRKQLLQYVKDGGKDLDPLVIQSTELLTTKV